MPWPPLPWTRRATRPGRPRAPTRPRRAARGPPSWSEPSATARAPPNGPRWAGMSGVTRRPRTTASGSRPHTPSACASGVDRGGACGTRLTGCARTARPQALARPHRQRAGTSRQGVLMSEGPTAPGPRRGTASARPAWGKLDTQGHRGRRSRSSSARYAGEGKEREPYPVRPPLTPPARWRLTSMRRTRPRWNTRPTR